MPDDFPEPLPLFGGSPFIDRPLRPLHLSLREITAEISIDPELGPRQINVAVVSLIHLVSVVELAEVFHLAVFVMRCRMRVEIAHAEVRTAACLDCGCIDRPIRRRAGMAHADGN